VSLNDNYWVRTGGGRFTRRRLLGTSAGLALAGATLGLAGCGNSNSGGEPKKTGSTLLYTPVDTSAKAIKGGVFPVSQANDVGSFDASSNASDATQSLLGYSRLLKYDAVKFPKPPIPAVVADAVVAWEISPDGTSYTYKLRPNFKFDPRPPTNGRAMTSADVKFSWDRFVKQNTMGANLANSVDPTGPIESVSLPDQNTVVLKLAFPYAPLNAMLGYYRHLPILPVEADGQFDVRNNMRGTSAWRLKEYVPSARVEYTRNPDWYDADKVNPDGLVYYVVPEYAAGLAQFRSGALGVFAVNQTDILSTKRDRPELFLTQTDQYLKSAGWMRFSYLPGSPFLDERVRQALSLLLDRDAIIDTFHNTKEFTDAGLPVPARWNSAIGAGIEPFWLDPKDQKAFGENAKYFQHNPAMAKQLMRAAGYTTALEAPFIMTTSGYGQAYADQGLVMKDMWESNGDFKLSVKDIDYRSDFRGNVLYGSDKHAGIAWGGTGGEDYPDVDGFLLAHWISGQPRTGHVGADGKPDAHLDDLVNQQRRETDLQKRIGIVQELQRYAAAKQYLISTAGDALGFQMAQPWVGNWGYYRSPSGGSPWTEGNIYWWIDSTKKS
jgi:ABC-type transport system substrate-binding protein